MATHKPHNCIRTHRKRSLLTQGEIAYLLRCDGSTISRYEESLRDCNLETAIACEVIFATPVRELFCGLYERVERDTMRRIESFARTLANGPPNKKKEYKLNVSLAKAVRHSTSPTKGDSRVLAIDPTARGFGYAVLEGTDLLLDWGTTSPKNANQDRERILKLIRRYSPRVVITEDPAKNIRRGSRGKRLIEVIGAICQEQRTKHRMLSTAQITGAFLDSGAVTKYQRAVAMTEHFPELGPALPKPRKPWKSEAEVMAVFGAVVLTIASKARFARSRERPTDSTWKHKAPTTTPTSTSREQKDT